MRAFGRQKKEQKIEQPTPVPEPHTNPTTVSAPLAGFGQTASVTPNVMPGRLPLDPSEMFDAYEMLHNKVGQGDMPWATGSKERNEPSGMLDVYNTSRKNVTPVNRDTERPGGAYTLSKFDNWFLHPTTQIGLAMASPGGNPAAAGLNAAKARAGLLQEPFLQDQAQANIFKTRADVLKARAEVENLPLKQIAAQQQAELTQKNKRFDQVQKIRGQITSDPIVAEIEGARRGVDYLKIRGIDRGEAISGQDAIAMIIDFYKIKDPRSAVLSGEVKTAGAEAEGHLAAINALLLSINEAGTLNKAQVETLYGLISGAYDYKLQQYNQLLGGYQSIVDSYGLPYEEIDVLSGFFNAPYEKGTKRTAYGEFSGLRKAEDIPGGLNYQTLTEAEQDALTTEGLEKLAKRGAGTLRAVGTAVGNVLSGKDSTPSVDLGAPGSIIIEGVVEEGQ